MSFFLRGAHTCGSCGCGGELCPFDLSKNLTPEGFHVVGAHSEARAMALSHGARGRLFLLIMDVEMIHGQGFTQRIRENYPEVPIVNCFHNLDQGLQLVKVGVCAPSIDVFFLLLAFLVFDFPSRSAAATPFSPTDTE